MSELSDFERGQIVGARMVGASVTKVAEVFGVSRGTVSKIFTAYRESGKTSSAKTQRGRKCVLSDRDRRALKRIVTKNKRTTAAKVTAEMNVALANPVSIKTTRRELHKLGIAGRAAIPKPHISDANARNRKMWCRSHKTWTMDQWKKVIWSDESCFTLFPTSGRVYVWRTPSQAYDTDCLLPRVKHGGGSVMIWAAISWYSTGPMVTLHGRITAKDYVTILGDQVHPMVQYLFPNGDAVFQDDRAPVHTAHIVQDWFCEHEDELSHLPWPPQSPDLNIIEPLWSTLERKVRDRYPPPSSLPDLASILQEEWYKIPLQTIQDLYLSIPRRLEAVLKANGFPTPY